MSISFILALLVSAAATPLVIWLARRRNWVVMPRDDRWHKKPTAIYGGVAIYAGFFVAFLLSGPHPKPFWVLFVGSSVMFAVGLFDDIKEMRPQMKFLAQVLVALLAVSQGIRLDQDLIPWPWLSMPLAALWLVGLTNAVNILDNMDGLAAGVVCVAGGVLTLGAFLGNFPAIGPLTAMLTGAAAGFLIYNLNPAKIFMGDCGSMFLGFTLAGASILSANTTAGASHLAMALLIPLGALVIPIFDTTLVSFQRTTHGRSIAKGGRDHSSHRLVFLGLSERRAVFLLLAISAGCGMGSLFLAHFATPLMAAVLVALLLVLLLFFGVYLGEVKVYDGGGRRRLGQAIKKSLILSQVLMHKKQIVQILVDMIMVSAAYTASWLLRFEGALNSWQLELLARSLPWLAAAKLVSFWLFGLYRGQWRYLSVYDVVQIVKGCVVGSLLTILPLALFDDFNLYSRSVLVIDFALCFMFVAGARSLIRVFREKVRGESGVPVLIVGAGDGGDLLLREIRNNSSLPYKPVGFVDDDPAKLHGVLHGVKVLGDRGDLERLIQKHKVERVFISILSARDQRFEDVFEICKRLGVECTRIQPMIKL